MIARFFSGMGYFVRGLRVAFARRVVPWLVVSAALLCALVFVAATLLTHLVSARGPHRSLLELALAMSSSYVLYMLYVASSLVVTALFASTISERVEEAHTGAPLPKLPWWRSFLLGARSLGHAILLPTFYVLIALPLYVVRLLVPSPVVWGLSIVQTAVFFAFDGFNEPLHRRGASFDEKWRFVAAHAPESLGFGLLVALLIRVPLVNLLVTPVAIAGGTLLYLDLTGSRRRA